MGRRDLQPYCLGVFALTLLLSSTSQFVIAEEALSNKEVITGETTPEAEEAYAPERWKSHDFRIRNRGRSSFLVTIDGELISIEEPYNGGSTPIDFYEAQEGGGDFIANIFEVVEGRGQYKTIQLGHISAKGKCTVLQEGDKKKATTQSEENITLSLPKQWPFMDSQKARGHLSPNQIIASEELRTQAARNEQPKDAIGWYWMDWKRHYIGGAGLPFTKTVYWFAKTQTGLRMYKTDNAGAEENIAFIEEKDLRIYWESDRINNTVPSPDEADYWGMITPEGGLYFSNSGHFWKDAKNYEYGVTITNGSRRLVHTCFKEFLEDGRDQYKGIFDK